MGSIKNMHSKRTEENCYVNERDYTCVSTYKHTHDFNRAGPSKPVAPLVEELEVDKGGGDREAGGSEG